MKPTRNLPAMLLDKEAVRFLSYLYPPRKPDKMIKLFRLLREQGGKELGREGLKKIERKIYGNSSSGNRLTVLNHRLQEKINDFLLSKSAMDNHPVLEKLHAAQVDIKKKHALYNFLHFTGRSGRMNDALMEKAIEQAKQNECYSDLLQLLHFQRTRMGYRYGEKEIDNAEKDIFHYKECEHAIRRASELYYRVLIRKKFSAHPNIPLLQKFVKSGIKELKALHKKTGSPEVLYFLKFLELDFFQNEKNFVQAKNKCDELVDVVQNNVSVFTRQRIDYVFGNLAQCHIYLGAYKQALKILSQQQYIIPFSLDWYESREMEFRVLFYQKKFTEAKRLLEVMRKNFPDDIEPIRKARINFYYASVMFMMHDYKKVQFLLHTNSELHKDKSGWAIAIRMLQVMLLLEQDKKEGAEEAIRQLQQFFDYNRKSNFISERDKIIMKLLTQTHLPSAQKLKKKWASYPWDPLEHELIPYDVWLERMALKKKPSHRR